MSAYDKIETDNPLLDEIMYNVKKIIKTCVIKNENEADKKESEEAFNNARMFIAIHDKKTGFGSWDDYIESDFLAVSDIVDRETLDYYIANYSRIPPNIKDKVVQAREKRFMLEFEEKNGYYREITGLPPIGDPGIFLTKEDIPDLDIECDFTKPLHEWSIETINILRGYGVLDKIIENNPKKYYLKHLYKQIDLYKARTEKDYSILYIDTSLESIIVDRFKELYEKNRSYIISKYQDNAYRLYNDYYDRFIIMLIIASTVCNMIQEMPEYFVRKEIFDIRTCQYFFESMGIDFFPEIPLKYQIRMVKQLNSLCKYKSTTKNLLEIADIFGQSNITIYQYYLNKYLMRDPITGEYTGEKNLRFVKVPLGKDVDDYAKNSAYHVSYDSVTNGDPTWCGPYDPGDIKNELLNLWDFCLIKSKYLSVDTVYSLTEITTQMAYFNHLILYSKCNLASLNFEISGITFGSNILNIFIYLFALGYLFTGYSDKILTDTTSILTIKDLNSELDIEELQEFCKSRYFELKDFNMDGTTANITVRGLNQDVDIPAFREYCEEKGISFDSYEMNGPLTTLNIRGFNFNVDMEDLERFCKDRYFTLEHFNMNKFTIPKGPIQTIPELMSLFKANKKLYRDLTNALYTAQSRWEFECIEKILDSAFIAAYNQDLYMIKPSEGVERLAESYSEYLKYKDPYLYDSIMETINLMEYTNDDIRQLQEEAAINHTHVPDPSEINKAMKEDIYKKVAIVTEYLQAKFDSDDVMYIFNSLPRDTANVIMGYIQKVLNFFKSFKITMHDMQNVYLMDEDYVYITDMAYIYRVLQKYDFVHIRDDFTLKSNLTFNDKVNIEDDINIIRYFEEED